MMRGNPLDLSTSFVPTDQVVERAANAAVEFIAWISYGLNFNAGDGEVFPNTFILERDRQYLGIRVVAQVLDVRGIQIHVFDYVGLLAIHRF